MIYITVGSYPEGFDRLIKYIDQSDLCKKFNFLVQTGNSNYLPINFKSKNFFLSSQHIKNIKKSKLVICHGGIATIMELIKLKKNFIVFPRMKHEAPNDQIYAMKKFKQLYNINVSFSLNHLAKNIVSTLKDKNNYKKIKKLPKSNVPEIIKKFIELN